MTSDVHVLDTQTWTWTRSQSKHGLPAPPPMASCAAVPLTTNPTVTRTLVFGGASLPDGGYAAGLRTSNALWKLAVTFDGKHHTWTRVNPDGERAQRTRGVATRLGRSITDHAARWIPSGNERHLLGHTHFLSLDHAMA